MRLFSLSSLVLFLAVSLFLQAAPVSANDLTGKVIETMNSGGYTYVHIENNGKKTWVAVAETKVVKGQTISFQPGVEMTNFKSKSLNRTFDSIIFSDGVATGPQAGGATTKGSVKSAITKEKIKVEKATGDNAFTVAQIYSKSKGLNKKPVVVRGKVVKVTEGIMQKNWVHIQDGTGTASKNDFNLVVTTQDLPAVGDIVTVKGTLAKNRDFGSGYKYAVIVEDASISK